MTPHILIIQSVYTDPELSRRRLAITRTTCVPSLAAQTRKPVVHLAQHYGPMLTRTLTYAFGRIEFAVAIKQLHREGKVQKHRDGWKLAD